MFLLRLLLSFLSASRYGLWYTLAVMNGDKTAAKDRDKLASQMTRAQLTEAQRLVRGWVEQHLGQ